MILDDFGLQAFDNFARETLMDIIDERFAKASTIISSQLPVSTWYDDYWRKHHCRCHFRQV
ncbi:MAG: ATP-binding protein [Owenweeksia sp.]|nr:ATP-binding protein [Owenweeksia sp.]